MPRNDKNIEALAEKYTQLRERKKALQPGIFDKDLSGSGGKLEEVLSELGKQLGKPEYREEDIIRIMGKPDALKVAGEYQPGSLGQNAPERIVSNDEVLIIYFWRGWHDYLYFVSKAGIIQRAQWYFAGE